MKFIDKSLCLAACIVSLLIGTAAPAGAQGTYPSKPIRIIVAFSPGTGSDTLARTMSEELTKQMGVSFVIENREGAGGNLGHAAGAKAPPDGYTILMGSSVMAMSVHMSNPPLYDANKDFAPIARVAEIPMVVVSSSTAKYKSWSELVGYAKANPTAFNYVTTGKGGSSHLFTELLRREFVFEGQDVPYKNVGQAVMDTSTGKMDMFLANLPPAEGLLQTGQLRAIAVGSGQRLARYPDVPTFAELTGKPDYRIVLWYGMFAPAGTPAPIVQRLTDEIFKASNTPAVKARIEQSGGVLSLAGPTELGDQLRSDNARFSKVLKDLGLASSN